MVAVDVIMGMTIECNRWDVWASYMSVDGVYIVLVLLNSNVPGPESWSIRDIACKDTRLMRVMSAIVRQGCGNAFLIRVSVAGSIVRRVLMACIRGSNKGVISQ